MAGPWEKYSAPAEGSGPWAKYGGTGVASGKQDRLPEAPSSMGEDILRSAGAGLRRGVEGIAGMMGDVGQAQSGLAGWVAGKLGASPETQQQVSKIAGYATPYGWAPPTSEVRDKITNPIVGEGYKPQTTAGEYARTVGEFAPAAIGGGGSLGRRAAMAVVPAIASETAGQVTEGTPYEPYARAGGAILGGAATALATPGSSVASTVARATEGATPQQMQAAERLFVEARNAGTPITRFEAIQQATGNATRAGDIQRVVEGQGGLRDFFATRPAQNTAAAQNTLDQITPATPAPSTIGPAVGGAAEDIVNDTRGAINTVTDPLYRSAAPQRIDPATFQQVQAAPGWAEARQAVRGDPQLERYVQGLPDDSVGFLNEVQKYLRQQSENASGAINAQRNQQRAAGYGVDATSVRTAAEQASPEFAQAVQAQAQLRQRYLDPLLQGPIGKIAARDTGTQQAIDALFPRNPLPNSAQEIGRTVGALSAHNPWAANQLVRAHIESSFNQAARDLQSGANQFGGAGFAAKLRGNAQQAANLEASIRALPNGDQLWQGMDRFLTIMEAQGTRQRIGSQTAFNQELQKDLRAGSPLGTAATVAAGGGITWPRRALDTIESWRLGRNVDELARLATDPQAADVFRRLSHQGDRRAIGTAIQLSLMARQASDQQP